MELFGGLAGCGCLGGVVLGFAEVGNAPHRGLTSDLPAGSCAEVACLASDLGVWPMAYGEPPAACAALNNVQINVQSLVVRAALEASPGLV